MEHNRLLQKTERDRIVQNEADEDKKTAAAYIQGPHNFGGYVIDVEGIPYESKCDGYGDYISLGAEDMLITNQNDQINKHFTRGRDIMKKLIKDLKYNNYYWGYIFYNIHIFIGLIFFGIFGAVCMCLEQFVIIRLWWQKKRIREKDYCADGSRRYCCVVLLFANGILILIPIIIWMHFMLSKSSVVKISVCANNYAFSNIIHGKNVENMPQFAGIEGIIYFINTSIAEFTQFSNTNPEIYPELKSITSKTLDEKSYIINPINMYYWDFYQQATVTNPNPPNFDITEDMIIRNNISNNLIPQINREISGELEILMSNSIAMARISKF